MLASSLSSVFVNIPVLSPVSVKRKYPVTPAEPSGINDVWSAVSVVSNTSTETAFVLLLINNFPLSSKPRVPSVCTVSR